MIEPQPLPPKSPYEAIESLRHSLADLFIVFDTTLDHPYPKYVRFRGQFLQDPAESFDTLRQRFEQHGYTPMLRREAERTALIAIPDVFRPPASNAWVNLILLVATLASTLYTGASYAQPVTTMADIWRGWPFALSIMLILGAHELGHYFAARYHQVPVTLPYFIPLPVFSLFGTMGAFIRLKAPVKSRRALFDLGAAGPLAGLVFAIPILIYGLATSPVAAMPPGQFLLEGNSLLYAGLKYAVLGQFLPAGNVDVQLNQVAWAGWVGLLVTGLNLLPVGQLDGGHVAYVLMGQYARHLFWPIMLLLGGLVIFSGATMWLFWILLLLALGRYYAEPLDDVTPLDPRRRVLAIFTLFLFVIVFVPVPLQIITR